MSLLNSGLHCLKLCMTGKWQKLSLFSFNYDFPLKINIFSTARDSSGCIESIHTIVSYEGKAKSLSRFTVTKCKLTMQDFQYDHCQKMKTGQTACISGKHTAWPYQTLSVPVQTTCISTANMELIIDHFHSSHLNISCVSFR